MNLLYSTLKQLEFKVFLYTIFYILLFNSIQYAVLHFFSTLFDAKYLYLGNLVGLTIALAFIILIYKRFNRSIEKYDTIYYKRVIIIILCLLIFKILIDPILNVFTIIDGDTLTSVDKSDIPIKYKLSYILSFSILTPIIEELFFRGILLEKLLSSKKKTVVVVIYSSFLFALIHVNPLDISSISIETLTVAFVLGMITAFIYVSTRNIYYCIVFHILNNIFSFLIFHVYNFEYVAIINYLSFDYRYWLIITLSCFLFLLLIKKFKLVGNGTD
jgi:membrane protease YdiL (CAAX protease family)